MSIQKSNKRKRQAKAPLVVAEIYCGAGGLSAGFSLAKPIWPKNKSESFELAYGVDHDRDAITTFRNHHFSSLDQSRLEIVAPCQNVTDVTAEGILKAIYPRKHVDILIGGPSCQGVSPAGLRNPDDHRNDMLRKFIELVRKLMPRWAVIENVPGLTHANNRELLRDIFKSLESIKGYKVAGDVLLAADYGVAQLRYRLFVVATNTGAPIRFPLPTHSCSGPLLPYKTVSDAIRDLSKRKPKQYDATAAPVQNKTQREIQNHYCRNISKLNRKRIEKIAPGQDWRSMPMRLLPDRYFASRASDMKGSYGRLAWNWPAYTITNASSNVTAGPFTHPKSDRVLSVREAARLQSFTDDHVFYGSVGSQYDQVGNAVPPLLAKAVAESVLFCHYKPREAKNWGKEGRLTLAGIQGALDGTTVFPTLTPRHVNPRFDRRKNHTNTNRTSVCRTYSSTWNRRRRPRDPHPTDTQKLRKLAREPNHYRATKRARAIVNFLDGKPKNLIIAEANVSETSVQKWIDNYFAHGLEGWRAYHKPVKEINVSDVRLLRKLETNITRVRRTRLKRSTETKRRARLHMNTHLIRLIRRFGNNSVDELTSRVESKLKTSLGTMYVGDLLAVAGVVLPFPKRAKPPISRRLRSRRSNNSEDNNVRVMPKKNTSSRREATIDLVQTSALAA